MAEGPHEDVTATLSQLERKLIELERELLTVAGATPSDPTSPPEPTAPAPAVPASPSLRDEIDELIVVRDRLRTLADELVERCDRLVSRLKS